MSNVKFIYLLLVTVLLITVITSCENYPLQAINTDESSIDEFMPLSEEVIENIIQDIDNRVAWIIEGLGGFSFRGDKYLALGNFTFIDGEIYKDYYDDDNLVYRRGSEYYEKIEGGVLYGLYY